MNSLLGGAIIIFLIVLCFLWVRTTLRDTGSLFGRGTRTQAGKGLLAPGDCPAPGDGPILATGNDPADVPEAPQNAVDLLYRIAEVTAPLAQRAARREDLLAAEPFRALLDLLRTEAFTFEDRLAYATGDNWVLGLAGLEALRQDEWRDSTLAVLDQFGRLPGWWHAFALRLLAERCPAETPITHQILVRAGEPYLYPPCLWELRDFIRARVAAGESIEPPHARERAQWELITEVVRRLGPDVPLPDGWVPPAAEESTPVAASEAAPESAGTETAARRPDPGAREETPPGRPPRVDGHILTNVGSVEKPGKHRAAGASPVSDSQITALVDRLVASLLRQPPRSVLLVGERGVGKSSVLRLVANRLLDDSWTIFRAGHTELQAGTMYIGSLEERLRKILDMVVSGRKVLWIVPGFHELLRTGLHANNPTTGVLHQLLPSIERGTVVLAGETEPGSYERLLRDVPGLASSMEVVTIEPMSKPATLEMAKEWVARNSPAEGPPLISPGLLGEAAQLAAQYITAVQPPGNLLELLQLATSPSGSGGSSGSGASKSGPITRGDLIAALCRMTGLPPFLLDERVPLDIRALRRRFLDRIQGQAEAVDCLVERVAMIKAGLCDPARPLGVFLFAGPTGTGKTELAKTLTEYLFGAPDRMIRLDMSELASHEGMSRILGPPAGAIETSANTALVHQIRNRPFSIILLDEIERTHPVIWDLFLQLFDDGRLTDTDGRTADFRNALIIMTSNLGGTIKTGAMGFGTEDGIFHPGAVERAVAQTFRKELLNRIDRVVIFHPLSRETMRSILFSELHHAVSRRGFARRRWMIEWDEAAIDFLLEKGFTVDLGARPLRRAVERYLLAPIATALLEHKVPERNPILLIKVDGEQLQVRFFEGEDSSGLSAPPSRERTAGERLSLEEIALDPEGSEDEVAALRWKQEELVALVQDGTWKEERDSALGCISRPGFWEAPERFAVLGALEYQERVREGLNRTAQVLESLAGTRQRDRILFPKRTVGHLAERLKLLETACVDVEQRRPRQAFLLVEAPVAFGRERAANEEFAARLGKMYISWARQRGMRLDVLEERPPGGRNPYRLLLAVSGFGAHAIIVGEAGMHVFESPIESTGGDRAFHRSRARVRVVPMPDCPAVSGSTPNRKKDLREEALRVLEPAAVAKAPGEIPVVRRYREEPSPLVRDSVRGWRTGRSDRVFAGDFDLIPAEGAEREAGKV